VPADTVAEEQNCVAAIIMAADAAGVAVDLVVHDVAGNHFHVPPIYTDVELIGLGGFGLVWCASFPPPPSLSPTRWQSSPVRHACGCVVA
jgi:hypothetical protein